MFEFTTFSLDEYNNSKGRNAEENFFKAWEGVKDIPEWIVSIERPTLEEDIKQKTDAVIVYIKGSTLKIQIKSYPLNYDECLQLMEYGVIPLSVLQNHKYKTIRFFTLAAIEKFKQYNEQKPCFSKNSSIKIVSKKVWYKQGQKRYR